MKKWSIIILFGIFIISGLLWGGYHWLVVDQDSRGAASQPNGVKADKDNELEEQQRDEIKGIVTEADLAEFKDQGLNPFGEQTKTKDLTDAMYQEYIHGMSHQKVKAEKKWGFYEIHPERIKWLLDGLDDVNVKHEDIYREILVKWKEGNFAEVDDDHNTIWSLQGGTVGKATGILSKEEEQDYVEKNAD